MRTPKKGSRRSAGKLRVFHAGKESPLPMLPLTLETIDAGYISPLVDLWTEQSSLRLTTYPHPRGALLCSLMISLKKEKTERAREAFEDRAIGKLNDGYTIERQKSSAIVSSSLS